jgi:cytochrome c oxidase subunit 2
MQRNLTALIGISVVVAFIALVIVMRPKPGGDVAFPPELAQGWEWVEDKGCAVCHSLDGAPSVGPSWKDVWGSQRHFTDGSSAVFDADYVRQSITDPAARVLAGYQNLMVPVVVTDAELDQLIMVLQFLAAPQEL